MIETIQFNVCHQEITTCREKLVADTINSYKCHFNFDSSWDGLNKTAIFVKGKRVIRYVLNNDECPFADELLDTMGTVCVGVIGTHDGIRYPTIKSKVIVIREGVVDGVEPTPPSQEIWEQLLNMIVAETNRAKDKENTLESALNEEISQRNQADNKFVQEFNDVHNLLEDKADKIDTYTKEEVDEKISQATPTDYEEVKAQVEENTIAISTKQEALVSGTNIKTINGQSLLGEGNIEIQSGGSSNYNDLANKPKINGIELQGNKSLEELNIQPKGNYITDPYYTHTDNNFTNPLKEKLEGLENYDDTDVKESIREVSENIPTKTSQLQNDSNFAEIDDLSTQEDKVWSASKVAQRFSEVEMAKFPNVTIFGQPTIQQGQISNFNATNYCQFPFIVNFQNQPFELDFEITTGNEVTQQHNIFDSQFGLAFAVRGSKFVLAVSTNGTSWNIGEVLGSHTVLPNSTYRIRLIWDKTNLTLEYSTDGGTSYVLDSTRALTEQPYPKQMFIGITSDKSTFFNGIINLNYAYLSIANKVIWQGMDDVGLATRADVSLSNLDDLGKQTIADLSKIQDVQINGTTIVVDGNANIPVGGAELGVVRVSYMHGISKDSNLYLHPFISNQQLKIRAGSGNAPSTVTSENMDTAVKYVLCDPTGSTTRNPAWTEEEQRQAQIRIGILSSEGVLF